jgi:glutamyl-tRNA synthetase
VLGPVEGVVDDLVVRRGDGTHAYNLAVVVDDHAQGIGEVVRGADLAETTHRQIWLAERLGLAVPAYAHVPLVLGPDGRRLAKRDGPVTLAQRRAMGETPARVRAALAASVGLCEPRSEPTLDSLLAAFSRDAVPREAPTIDLPAG